MKAKENGQMEEFRKKLMEELNRKLGKGYELWVTDVTELFYMAFQF